MPSHINLENLDRVELLATVRRLLAEADALSSRISAVNEIGTAMARTLDLSKIERVIAKQAKWLIDFAHCSVCLRDGETWQLKTLFGPEEPKAVDLSVMPNISIPLKTGQAQLIHNGSDSPLFSKYLSQLIIPLTTEDTVLGTINFVATDARQYTSDDMRIAYMLSLQLTSALRNANMVTALRQTQQELSMRVEELDAYGHTIAHDLKTPLASILLRCEMFTMNFPALPSEALQQVSEIAQSAKNMNRMIEQLLWLAKLRNTLEYINEVNVLFCIQAALQRVSVLTEEKNITVEIDPNLPNAYGHGQWVEEVFANLIGNSIKYMGEHNPQPKIRICGRLQGDFVRYEVVDTGVGIKPEDQKRLFEMFTRLKTVKVEGLGLGLSIVRRIVQKLGGEVGVESVFGEGSTFWFTLPAKVNSSYIAPTDLIV
jgi:signal transduction histidine kinase